MAVQKIVPVEGGTALGSFAIAPGSSLPMHLSGAVQDQGALLVLDRRGTAIRAASTSIASFTGYEAREILGEPATWATGIEDLGDILRSAGVERAGGAHVPLDVTLPWIWQDHAVLAYLHGIAYVVEFVPSERISAARFREHFLDAQDAIHRLAATRTRSEAADLCVAALQRLTGYDTVGVVSDTMLAVTGPLTDAAVLVDLERQGAPRRAVELIFGTGGTVSRVLPGESPETGLPYDLSGAYLCAPEPAYLAELRMLDQNAALRFALSVSGGVVSCLSAGEKRPAHETVLLSRDIVSALDRRFAELRP